MIKKPPKNAVEIDTLSKTYLSQNGTPSTVALNKVSLKVPEGSFFGLLGPNGAGKSTFINILAGTVLKSSGSVNVWGFDLDKNPREVRASIGIVPQEVSMDPFFSPKDLLELQAGLYGVKKTDRVTDAILKLVSLENHKNTYSRRLSGGMKRRLLIAKALVHQPPIVILDEPTAGVDVKLRKMLWENIKLLNEQGVTIILTTHYLQEAEKMCNRIGILNKGELVALDSTKNLIDRIQNKIVKFKLDKNIKIDIYELNGIKVISNDNNTLNISYEKNKLHIEEIINFIQKNNAKIYDISTNDGDLEEVFISLTKN